MAIHMPYFYLRVFIKCLLLSKKVLDQPLVKCYGVFDFSIS